MTSDKVVSIVRTAIEQTKGDKVISIKNAATQHSSPRTGLLGAVPTDGPF